MMDVYLFGYTSPELNGDCTVNMNTYNLKGTRGFDGKFPFDSVIILEDSLSNTIVIVDMPLIILQKHIIY